MSSSKHLAAQPAPVAPARGSGSGVTDRPTLTTASNPGRSHAPASALPLPNERGERMRDEWPLRSYLELGVLPGAVPCARLHAMQVLWEWGLTGLRDDVELLVSELVTNAVRVSQSMRGIASVRLWLRSDKRRVLILVWDGNPRPPVRIDATEDAESGRGLLLVETISDRWNWYRPNGMDGKIVWAEVSVAQPPELPRRVPGEYR